MFGSLVCSELLPPNVPHFPCCSSVVACNKCNIGTFLPGQIRHMCGTSGHCSELCQVGRCNILGPLDTSPASPGTNGPGAGWPRRHHGQPSQVLTPSSPCQRPSGAVLRRLGALWQGLAPGRCRHGRGGASAQAGAPPERGSGLSPFRTRCPWSRRAWRWAGGGLGCGQVATTIPRSAVDTPA